MPSASPNRPRRARRLSTLVLGMTVGVFTLVALPSLWFARRTFEEAHLSSELGRIGRVNTELAEILDDRLQVAETSIARVARLLDDALMDLGHGDVARFDELVEPLDDGTLRSVRAGFDGTHQAGVFVPAGTELTDQDRATFVIGTQVLERAGVVGSDLWDSLWMFSASAGGVMLQPSHPEFTFALPADLSVEESQWLALAGPSGGPGDRPLWTTTGFDKTSESWMLSVVTPFHLDGRWAGAVGHDVPAGELSASPGSRLLVDGAIGHVVRSDGTLIQSDRHRQLIVSSAGRAMATDTEDELLVEALASLGESDGHSVRVADDERSLFVQESERTGWRFVREVPHAVVLASLREGYDMLWTAFVALAALLSLLPTLLVARLVRRSVSGLVEASTSVSAGDLTQRFPDEGPAEFRTIAKAIQGMVARLSESQQRTRAVLETVADGVITIDAEGRIESLNLSAGKMFGSPSGALVGRAISVLGPAFASVEELLVSGDDTTTWALDCLPDARRADGSSFPVDVQARLTVAADRHLVTLTVRDLSRRQGAERRRIELEEQLRQVQKMEAVGQLAGGVAHDFNNLLTGIMGYAEELQREQEPGSEAQRDAGQILRAAERAAALTRQLLLFSRRQELRPEDVDLNDLLTQVTPMLRRVLSEDHELTVSLKPDLGGVRVDASRMEQVVMNLVVNAADAQPDGGTIRVTTGEQDVEQGQDGHPPLLRPGRYVTLSVADDGEGMDDEVRAAIFEPFFTTKQPGRGTGLGLATVFGVVKESEGEIAVRSAPGEGSEFRVYLPRRGERPATWPDERTRAPRGERETVLVVEDELTVRRLVQRLLLDQGYQVLLAADGAEALDLEAAHDGAIDLLLTDIVMPGLSGPALAEELSLRRPGTPVLYMSGWSADALAERGQAASEIELVAKPFGLAELSRRVRVAIESGQGAPA
jgi:PAS domain S-box-containing protein